MGLPLRYIVVSRQDLAGVSRYCTIPDLELLGSDIIGKVQIRIKGKTAEIPEYRYRLRNSLGVEFEIKTKEFVPNTTDFVGLGSTVTNLLDKSRDTPTGQSNIHKLTPFNTHNNFGFRYFSLVNGYLQHGKFIPKDYPEAQENFNNALKYNIKAKLAGLGYGGILTCGITGHNFYIMDQSLRSTRVNTLYMPPSCNGLLAYDSLHGVKKLNLSGDIWVIPKGLFDSCGILEITLPKGLRKIESYAFNNNSFSEIKFPDTLERMGNQAFSNNPNLQYLDLSNTKLSSLSVEAFKDCSNLREVKLPPSLNTIMEFALFACPSLSTIYTKIPPEEMNISNIAFSNKPKFVLY